MTGKSVQIVVKTSPGLYRTEIDGDVLDLDEASLKSFLERSANAGMYPYVATPDELAELRHDSTKSSALFARLIRERLEKWIDELESMPSISSVPLIVCPGNDDDLFVDDVLARSERIVNLSNRVLALDAYVDIVGFGYSNPTPWHTPREMSEDDIAKSIETLMASVRDPHHTIFDFHVPPKDTTLDQCAKLDSELRVVTHLGRAEMFSAGSSAVRTSVEKYQPILGLFGHVHESHAFTRIGSTLCINPGSNYSEGILSGCVVTIEKGRISEFQLTSG